MRRYADSNNVLTATAALVALAASAPAQSTYEYDRNIYDGSTQPAVAVGNPTGDFPVSGLDQVNLFNGRLSVNVPVLTVRGRGGVSYVMTVKVDRPSWYVDREVTCTATPGSADCVEEIHYTNTVLDAFWAGTPNAGYGPGLLTGRTASQPYWCVPQQGSPYMRDTSVLKRFTLLRPDGSEAELRDVQTDGKPLEVNPIQCHAATSLARGDHFGSADGSGVDFYSDSPITDVVGTNPLVFSFQGRDGAGSIKFRDGTVYTVANFGLVTQITDRNGNALNFTYDANGRVTAIKDDPAGNPVHTVSVSYGPTGTDEISYPGLSGVTRKIQVKRVPLAQAKAAAGLLGLQGGDFSACTDPAMAQCNIMDNLFPQAGVNSHLLAEARPNNPTPFNPDVISQIVLPNGKTYDFKYNRFGEVASIKLPTGGEIQYIHGAGLGTIEGSNGILHLGFGYSNVYRRVTQRQQYTPAGLLESTIQYQIVTEQSLSGTRVTQTGLAAGRVETHWFEGDARVPSVPYGYPKWKTGLLVKVEEGSLRTTEHTWLQRACSAWYPLSGSPECLASNPSANLDSLPVDPRISETKTTLHGAPDKFTKVKYAYSGDNLNNRTKVEEYDFGGATLLRNTRKTDSLRRPDDSCSSFVWRRASAAFALLRNTRKTDSLRRPDDPCSSFVWRRASAAFALPRQTETTWVAASRGNGGAAHLLSLPETRKVKEGGGAWRAGAILTYDAEGNLVQEQTCLVESCGSNLLTSHGYDAHGNRTSTTDPRGGKTTFEYEAAGCVTHYLSKITQQISATPNAAVDHVTTIGPDCATGKPVTVQDPKGLTTQYGYVDALDRLTSAKALNQTLGPEATHAYTETGVSNYVETLTKLDAMRWIKTRRSFDGFGRTTRQETFEDGVNTIKADTTYDGAGRPYLTSNPYRGVSQTGSTSTTFDDLSRPVVNTHPDGATTTYVYATNQTKITDPAAKERYLKQDALGRLVSVCEAGTDFACTGGDLTAYEYDVLDNLTKVTQGTQVRTFAYDAASRLICASNPESRVSANPSCHTNPIPGSGLDRFTYDANGNLLTKTDARGVITTNSYDSLNRLTGRTYTGGAVATPAETFTWDNGTGCAKTLLCSAVNSISTTSYAYDSMGRVTGSTQLTGGGAYPFSYTYNNAGLLTKTTYPTNRQVQQDYDLAGRATKAFQVGGATYADNITYAAHGPVASLARGTLTEAWQFNNRLQPTVLDVEKNGQNKFSLTLGYGAANNGNLMQQTIRHEAHGAIVQDYLYDLRNRIAKATETPTVGVSPADGWQLTYGYDSYSNRWVSSVPAESFGLTLNGVPNGSSWFTTQNRVTGEQFDDAGNALTTHGVNLTYDANNRMVQNQRPGLWLKTYGYDAEGRRVTSNVAPGVRRVFVHDAFGKLAAEYRDDVETYGCTTCYLTRDWLGSTRMVTDGSGTATDRYDYTPFGRVVPGDRGQRFTVAGYGTGLGSRWRFTGKERDFESGLDYFGARYFSGVLGRFTGADPFLPMIEIEDLREHDEDPEARRTRVAEYIVVPHNWNRYAYALGNPLKFVDPDGRIAVLPILAAAWAGYEIGSAVYDAYTAYRTIRNPHATAVDKLVVTGGLVASVLGPGGGYGTAGRAAAQRAATVSSSIGRDHGLVRLAEQAGKSVQRSLDNLVSQLASGNLNPGIGTKSVFGNVFEARARDGARVYFRQGKDGVEILAKSDKGNQDQVIKRLRELYHDK